MSVDTGLKWLLDTQPMCLTKKWLRLYFDAPYNNKRDYLILFVFTPDVLEHLELTKDEYSTIRIFTALQSKRIRELFAIPFPYEYVGHEREKNN